MSPSTTLPDASLPVAVMLTFCPARSVLPWLTVALAFDSLDDDPPPMLSVALTMADDCACGCAAACTWMADPFWEFRPGFPAAL
ncbi:hypothetical protein GO285_05284 [Ralstonia solanacearum]|nr:hypothetical protein [Ralstonia solanacearum]NKB15558.1 hypothetical protein [Ralstonia solanacearum]NKF62681.1 hypothetical protein [Ralstonia solanacearum]NKF98062.1 hypothetical protein [Ralstonia solanacearum]NKG13453.1 hypothetical protein [Ralstonia solanacearum]